MAGDNGSDEIPSLFYRLLRGYEAFSRAGEEYKSRSSTGNNGNGLKEILGMIEEDEIVDSLINKAPMKYRPILKVAKDWPWSFTIDVVSTMLKKYGENESGDYKKTGEVFRDLITNKIRDKLFGR